MANFEAFRWNFSSSTKPEIGRSEMQCYVWYWLNSCFINGMMIRFVVIASKNNFSFVKKNVVIFCIYLWLSSKWLPFNSILMSCKWLLKSVENHIFWSMYVNKKKVWAKNDWGFFFEFKKYGLFSNLYIIRPNHLLLWWQISVMT